jgi:hypothetical protein
VVVASVSVDVLTALLGVHVGLTSAILVSLIRTREKVTKLEEWARLQEKRLNGLGDG